MELKDIINPKYLTEEKLEELSVRFENGNPCKHIVLKDFFREDIAEKLHDNFPTLDSLKVVRKSLNENKREDYHFERWDPVFTKVRDTFTTDAMGHWLSQITGINDLFTNTDPLGQGVHQGGDGSFLDVHIDVNVNVAKKLWRRINLLVYMNKDWKPEYGGDVELWNKSMTECVVKYPPSYNTAVIFLTDENSPHGYSKMNLPEGLCRKSYYAYFYTKLEEGVEYKDSKFLSKPDDAFAKKVATSFKETVKIKLKQILTKLNIRQDFQDKN